MRLLFLVLKRVPSLLVVRGESVLVGEGASVSSLAGVVALLGGRELIR